MRVSFTYGTSGTTIHDWAYADSAAGLEVGMAPEPETYALIFGLLTMIPVLWLKLKKRVKDEGS